MPDAAWGMVKLTPEQQEILIAAEPAAFKPAAGAWGRRGSTHVRLAAIDRTTLRSALAMAWRNTAHQDFAVGHIEEHRYVRRLNPT